MVVKGDEVIIIGGKYGSLARPVRATYLDASRSGKKWTVASLEATNLLAIGQVVQLMRTSFKIDENHQKPTSPKSSSPPKTNPKSTKHLIESKIVQLESKMRDMSLDLKELKVILSQLEG